MISPVVLVVQSDDLAAWLGGISGLARVVLGAGIDRCRARARRQKAEAPRPDPCRHPACDCHDRLPACRTHGRRGADRAVVACDARRPPGGNGRSRSHH